MTGIELKIIDNKIELTQNLLKEKQTGPTFKDIAAEEDLIRINCFL